MLRRFAAVVAVLLLAFVLVSSVLNILDTGRLVVVALLRIVAVFDTAANASEGADVLSLETRRQA